MNKYLAYALSALLLASLIFSAAYLFGLRQATVVESPPDLKVEVGSMPLNLDCKVFFEEGTGGHAECFPANWETMTEAERLEWANREGLIDFVE